MVVIYAMKTPENDLGMNLPLLIGKALDKRGLMHNWISEDYRAKRSYDVTTESVTISTIHSVKGFGYACVFLLVLDWLAPGRWTEEQFRRLAYVAVIRDEDLNKLVDFRWGLIPSWAKDPAVGNKMFNARAETITGKPSFREAFNKRRCLVVADGLFPKQSLNRVARDVSRRNQPFLPGR
jgi:hypothetical protein